MLGYITIGTNDLSRAAHFYDPVFAEMGLKRRFELEEVVCWGGEDEEAGIRVFVCRPFDGAAATVGNGSMAAFRLPSASEVRKLHALALVCGGSDEGAPGFRTELYGDAFYVAYLRDPDGNKLALYCDDGRANP